MTTGSSGRVEWNIILRRFTGVDTDLIATAVVYGDGVMNRWLRSFRLCVFIRVIRS